MKKRFGIILTLSLGLLSAHAALASDAVLGAVVGGGLGAMVGNHVSGRNGAVIGGAVGAAAGAAIASDNDGYRHRRSGYAYVAPAPVHVYSPAPVYAPTPVYAPAAVYYAPPPVRIVRAPVVYVPVHGQDWRYDHRGYRHERDHHRNYDRYDRYARHGR